MQHTEKKLKNLAKGKKLLLIEDDVKTSDILKRFLSEYFSLIKVAYNGKKAWKMYRQEHFDLVISDIELPETNGVLLSKGIKAKNPNQAIIISSAYTDEKYLVELINIGVDGFIKKPVNIPNLLNTIVKSLSLVQQRAEYSRVRFTTLTKEITQKDIVITKSPYQKVIEDSETQNVKTSIKEFMEKIQKDDSESYDFLMRQKEDLFDNLHDMVETYEIFAYKNYTDDELLKKLTLGLYNLHATLEYFNKVQKSAKEILRLADILDTLRLDHLTESQIEGFDILEFLINDIKQYIMDMFIEENVQDVNYFHASLKENITTFEDSLNGKDDDDEDDDEIEFL